MGEIRKVAKDSDLSDSVGDLVPVGFTEVSRRTSDILHKDGGFDVERWDKLTWRNGARFVAWQDGETYEGKYTTLKQKVRVPKALATWKRWRTSYASECQFLLVKLLSTKRNWSTWRMHATGTKLQESGSKALKEKSSRRRMNWIKSIDMKLWNCHWLFVRDKNWELADVPLPTAPIGLQDVQVLSRGEFCGGDREAKAVDEFGGFATSMLQAVHPTEMLWNEEIWEITVPSCPVNYNMTTCNGTVSVSWPLKVVQDDANPDARMCEDLNQSLISMESPCNWQHLQWSLQRSLEIPNYFFVISFVSFIKCPRHRISTYLKRSHIRAELGHWKRVEFGLFVHSGAQADRLKVFTQRPQKGSSWDAASASRTSQSKRILCGSCVVHPSIPFEFLKKTFGLIHRFNSDIHICTMKVWLDVRAPKSWFFTIRQAWVQWINDLFFMLRFDWERLLPLRCWKGWHLKLRKGIAKDGLSVEIFWNDTLRCPKSASGSLTTRKSRIISQSFLPTKAWNRREPFKDHAFSSRKSWESDSKDQ